MILDTRLVVSPSAGRRGRGVPPIHGRPGPRGAGAPFHRIPPYTPSEPMTESKSRSPFLTILFIFVGVVICAALVVAFVPVVSCDWCKGVGWMTNGEVLILSGRTADASDKSAYNWICRWCSGNCRRTLFRTWFKPLPDPDPFNANRGAAWMDDDFAGRVLELRKRLGVPRESLNWK